MDQRRERPNEPPVSSTLCLCSIIPVPDATCGQSTPNIHDTRIGIDVQAGGPTNRWQQLEALGLASPEQLLAESSRATKPNSICEANSNAGSDLRSNAKSESNLQFEQSPYKHFEKVRIAQAWSGADNLNEDRLTTMARHDLVFGSPQQFKLQFDRDYDGLSKSFTPESINEGQRMRNELKEKNPEIKLLTELRYRDAKEGYLPDNSAWWLRADGKRVEGYHGKGPQYWMLDFTNPQLQDRIAEQAAAVVKSGVADGVMLDWFNDGRVHGKKFDDARLLLVDKIRRAIGPDSLILINTNGEEMPLTLTHQVNGYYMENTNSQSGQDWDKIARTLDYAEKATRKPHINVVETWFDNARGREQTNKMRATVGLAMTHAPDSYALFGEPDGFSSQEHSHNWYSYYDAKIGKATGPRIDRQDGGTQREYENGTVVYNPKGNGHSVTVEFSEARISAASGKRGFRFTIEPEDSDIFLRH
jgi:hypothetical protein